MAADGSRRKAFLLLSSLILAPITVPSSDTALRIPSVSDKEPYRSSIMRGAYLSILINLLAPVTIATRALRCASKRGSITRLRPTAPLSILIASSLFIKKAFAELASTTSDF